MLESESTIGRDDAARLVGVLAHDLRQHVGALSHQIDLLADGGIDASTRRRCLQNLVAGGEELNRFVDSLADLERTLGEAKPAKRIDVDLRTLVRAAVADRAGAVLDTATAPGSDATVRTDPSLARRMIQELIAESGTRSDTVSIELTCDEGSATLSIGGRNGALTAALHRSRPVVIDDGLVPWIAHGLGRLCAAEVDIEPSSYTFVLRFALAGDLVQSSVPVED